MPLGSLVKLSFPSIRQDCATSSRSFDRSAMKISSFAIRK
jgi:hypothetical protein